MRKIKNFISLMLVFSLFFSANVIMAEETDSKNDATLRLLNALNIVDFESCDDTYVTRAEFTDMVVRALGYSDETISQYSGDAYFNDIDIDNKYFNSVSIAAQLGLISGYENGRFYPDGNMKTEYAVGIAIKVLGGNNTESVANIYSSDLHNGITSGENLDEHGAVVLIKNMLDAYPFVASLSTKLSWEKSDETLLCKVFSIHEIKGIINSTEVTHLYKQPEMREDYVLIGDVECYTQDNTINAYLGCYAEAYVRENDYDEFELVSYSISGKNKVIEIKAEDICEDTTIRSIEYIDGSRTKRVDISSADMIYNNELLMQYTDSDIKIANGIIKLIDNNSDSEVDAVVVEAYTNYVVSDISSTTKKMFFMYGKPEFNFEEDEYIITDTNGDEVSYLMLEKYDVLAVYESKTGEAEKIYAVLSDIEPVSGKVVKTGEEDEKHYVGIGDEIFFVDRDYYALSMTDSKMPEMKNGLESTFYFSIDGEIAAVSEDVVSGDFYGYLTRTYYDEYNEELYFKIFTQTGEYLTIPAAEKISFNGETKKRADRADIANDESLYAVYSGERKQKPQIVKYELNKGTVKKLYTPNKTEDFSVEGTGEPVEYVSRRQASVFAVNSDSEIKYCYDNMTKVFRVPEYIGGEISPDDFAISSVDTIGGDRYYLSTLYDVDEDTRHVGCMVLNERATATWDSTAKLLVVESIKEGLNSDDEAVTIISGMNSEGVKKSYYMSKKDYVELCNLHKGDIVSVVANSDDDVLGIRKMLTNISREDDKQTEYNNLGHVAYAGVYTKQSLKEDSNYTSDYSDFASVYGITTGKTAKNVVVKTHTKDSAGAEVSEYKYPVGIEWSPKVFVVDYSSKTPRVTMGSLSDIREEGSEVFVWVANYMAQVIYVINR